MAETYKPEPGTRARLIREGVQRHPDLTTDELAALLNSEHRGLGLVFRSADVRHVRQIFREEQRLEVGSIPYYQPLFTDRIPPVREYSPIQATPPVRAGQYLGAS